VADRGLDFLTRPGLVGMGVDGRTVKRMMVMMMMLVSLSCSSPPSRG
jgi:hypothetical protein